MVGITPISRPSDYPGTPDALTAQSLHDLFAMLFPGVSEPEIDAAHRGIAIAAHNPSLAAELARLSGFMVKDMGWSQRRDWFELAVEVVNRHFGCEYTSRLRRPHALAAGMSAEQWDAIGKDWESDLFAKDQALVIALARAALRGPIADNLLSEAVATFGQKGVVECTAVVGFWSLWAMMLNLGATEGGAII